MGDPAKLGQAERQMQLCIDRIEEGVVDLVDLTEKAAQARHEWEKAKALKLVEFAAAAAEDPDLRKAYGSAEMREAWVMTQPGMDVLHLGYKLAEAIATSSSSRLSALRSEGDLLRSLAKSEREVAEHHQGRR